MENLPFTGIKVKKYFLFKDIAGPTFGVEATVDLSELHTQRDVVFQIQIYTIFPLNLGPAPWDCTLLLQEVSRKWVTCVGESCGCTGYTSCNLGCITSVSHQVAAHYMTELPGLKHQICKTILFQDETYFGALDGGVPMSHVVFKKWSCPLSLMKNPCH